MQDLGAGPAIQTEYLHRQIPDPMLDEMQWKWLGKQGDIPSYPNEVQMRSNATRITAPASAVSRQ